MNHRLFPLYFIILFGACESPEKGLDQLFPGPGFEKGWSWEGMPKHYTPDTIHEHMKEGAELYLTNGIKELVSLKYFYGDKVDSAFVIDVYDMGSNIHAFGLYSSYRHPESHYEPIGTEAIISDSTIQFFQGQFFINAMTDSDSDRIRNAMKIVSIQLASRIDQPADYPHILNLLHVDGLVERSIRYHESNMLNQNFLPAGLTATYRINDVDINGFIIFYQSPEEALSGQRQLHAIFQGDKESVLQDPVIIQSKDLGTIMLTAHERYLIGVHDVQHEISGRTFLRRFREHVSATVMLDIQQ